MEYGLIGEKLGHSFSKLIHASIADYNYILKELKPTELEEFIKAKEYKGLNVTIPYKEQVIPMLDEVSEAALKIGAVNTIVNRNGKLYGYNTDASGLENMILYYGIEVSDKKVLILGTGGTSKTAFYVAKKMGAAEVYKVSRSGRDNSVTYEEAYEKHADADVIINTTPAGMYPDITGCPIDLDRFNNLSGVVDVIFNPLQTNLVMKAKEKHIKACGGLHMLAGQAVVASAKFQNLEKVNLELTQKAYREVLSQIQNVVLIGMPSAGKTTVGKRFANLSGKTFVDTDDVIIERIGCPIREYFEKYGEAAFRKIEKQVIAEKALEKNLVIATGGGAVLDPDNVKELKRNGLIIMIDRSMDKLTPTADRPLLQNREMLEKLFADRYDKYISVADVVIDGNGTVPENTEQVMKVVLDMMLGNGR